ncbi:MAG: site-2 protease family protein [Chloroflexi bacterium]|nr:site-2 protease family protein [Chloroflexota bacterium]MQC25327.1 site-2 protease family protein [Chloroflexota bacterium]MQC47471.1 site-2 protease family protein [Chloroflexota bacterium]
MILTYVSIIGEAPLAFAILMAAFVVSLMGGLIFHEFCHAYVADRLGDRTARYLGRLTLDPRAHYDPVGTTLIFFVGFGWAKPVPVNPANTRNPKQAMTAIALAGPASNLVIAGLAGIPIKLGLVRFYHPFVGASNAEFWAQMWTSSPQDLAGLFLGTVLFLNVLLGVFNMLPIPPLDGSRVLAGLLPPDLASQYARLEPWGFGILMLLVLSPFITNGQFSLFTVIGPVVRALIALFAGDAGAMLFR